MTAPANPGRVMVAKPGLDGHDRGAHVVARMLRDAGYEVIYTGLRQRPAAIAAAATQEDVDMLGLSVLSGAHMGLCRAVLDELARLGNADLPVVLGGVIPDDDRPRLHELGIACILGPESPREAVLNAVRDAVALRRAATNGSDALQGHPAS